MGNAFPWLNGPAWIWCFWPAWGAVCRCNCNTERSKRARQTQSWSITWKIGSSRTSNACSGTCTNLSANQQVQRNGEVHPKTSQKPLHRFNSPDACFSFMFFSINLPTGTSPTSSLLPSTSAPSSPQPPCQVYPFNSYKLIRRIKFLPVMLVKKPAGHDKQNASCRLLAPAPRTHSQSKSLKLNLCWCAVDLQWAMPYLQRIEKGRDQRYTRMLCICKRILLASGGFKLALPESP